MAEGLSPILPRRPFGARPDPGGPGRARSLRTYRRPPRRSLGCLAAIWSVAALAAVVAPPASAGTVAPSVNWRAPFHGHSLVLHYLAAQAACAHGGFSVVPGYNRTQGAGWGVEQSHVNSTGCRYPGLRYDLPLTDWIFGTRNITGSGTHNFTAVWRLHWTVNLSVNAPLWGPGCHNCRAVAGYVIGVWVEIYDATTGSSTCGLPCPVFGWTIHHALRNHAAPYQVSRSVQVAVSTGNFSFVPGDAYQVFTGVEAYCYAGADGPLSTARASFSFGSGPTTAGLHLWRIHGV